MFYIHIYVQEKLHSIFFQELYLMLISYYHHNDKESINSVVLINELIKYIWYICRLSTRHIKEKHFSSAITCIEDNISLISVYIHHKQKQKKKQTEQTPKQNQTKTFTCCTQLVFSWSWVWIMSALSQLNYHYKHYPSMCTLYELKRKSVHIDAFLTTHQTSMNSFYIFAILYNFNKMYPFYSLGLS